MRYSPYAKKTRQLKHIAKLINRNIAEPNFSSTAALQKLIQKLQQLVRELNRIFSKAYLVRIIGAAACFIGFQAVHAQNFETPVLNPYGLISTELFAMPVSVDLDNDGDLDLMVGEYYGNFKYFENIGTKSNPQYKAPQHNPFGITPPYGYINAPSIADLDNDGDFDMLVGGYYGAIYYFENTGTKASPQFASPVSNPFSLQSVYSYAVPTFIDLDNDGDMDLFVGEYYGNLQYFENIGTASAPEFDAPLENPFNLDPPDAYLNCPTFTDLDSDGDLDMLIGGYYGALYYFENTGNKTAPDFGSPVLQPFGLTTGNYIAFPHFVDLDDDGDKDLIVGEAYGNFRFFKNTEKVSSIVDLENNNTQFTVYPNPSSDVIRLKTDLNVNKVELLDISGKLLFSTNEAFTDIQVSMYPAGIYFIQITDKDGRTLSSKFEKK